jgi:dienelactone hydrolase
MWKLIGDEDVGDRPIRIFQGGADDWTTTPPIERYVQRVRAAGHANITLVVYDGGHHGFDLPNFPNPPRSYPESLSFARCLFIEQPGGIPIDSETGGLVSTSLPCFSRGNTVGYHPQAHAQMIRDVRAFLGEVFRLP